MMRHGSVMERGSLSDGQCLFSVLQVPHLSCAHFCRFPSSWCQSLSLPCLLTSVLQFIPKAPWRQFLQASLSLAATLLSPGLGLSSSGWAFRGTKTATSEQRGLASGEQAVQAPFSSLAPAHGILPCHSSQSSAAKCNSFGGSGVTKVP